MVAQTIQLPNVRKLYLPDPGYTMVEVDLQRADAQVVAWEANDDGLKEIFRRGDDIHTSNALAIFGGPGPLKAGEVGYSKWYDKRHRAKTGVHAVNYGCKEKTLAEHIQCSIQDARAFIESWFAAHPPILEWHKRVEYDLLIRKCVENKFGYKRHYFDRVEGLLPEALAWIGQSTVAIAINHVLLAIEEAIPEAQLLLQVHDSILFQIPTISVNDNIPTILEKSRVPIPYDDPLIIPPTIAISEKSWGDVREIKFAPNGLDWYYKDTA